MQLAGKIMEAKYPRVSIFHGTKHIIALMFGDIGKIPIVKKIVLRVSVCTVYLVQG